MEKNLKILKKIYKIYLDVLPIHILVIYILSYLFPRDRKLWAFGGMSGVLFSDNTKHFFMYLNRNQKNDISCVWISKDKKTASDIQSMGMKAYFLFSFKGVYYALRSGVYIFTHSSNDISFSLSGGAKKVNLWHGIPLKKINYDNENDEKRNPKGTINSILTLSQRLRKERPTHYLLSTSEYLSGIFTSSFRIPKKNIIYSGYPRNDVFFNDPFNFLITSEEKAFYTKIFGNKSQSKEKILIYLPTFRKPEFELNFFLNLDLKELDKVLVNSRMTLIFKLHPKSKIKDEILKYSLNKILIAPWEMDPYPLIAKSDGLITDYSSIFFDYLLMDKPVIFFPYDLDDYITHNRDLYYDYEEFVPGPIARTQNELFKILSEVFVNGNDNYKKKRYDMKVKFFKYHDGLSSERLFLEIKNRVLNKGDK